MYDIMQNLADVNYIIFCCCLQFVLLVVYAMIQNFPAASLPHLLALQQLQANAVLFVGHVIWALVSPTSTVTTTPTSTPAFTGEGVNSDANTDTEDSTVIASPVEDIPGAPKAASLTVHADVLPTVSAYDTHSYRADTMLCLRDAGMHVSGLYLVLSLGVLLLCIASNIACGSDPTERLCTATWQSKDGLWIGITYTLIQVSVCVTSVMLYARKKAGSAPGGLGVFNLFLYTLFVWGIQYILDKYYTLHATKSCIADYQGSQQLAMYTYVFVSISGVILFFTGCTYSESLSQRLDIDRSHFILSSSIVLPLNFVFCTVTIYLMYTTHNDKNSMDAILVSYIVVGVLCGSTFIRALTSA